MSNQFRISVNQSQRLPISLAPSATVKAVSVVDAWIDGDDLILELSDGSTINAGDVRGEAGVSISSITRSGDDMLITLSDGTIVTFGNVRGSQGARGDHIVLAVNDGVVQWRLSEDTVWYDLISISAMKGDQGEQGVGIDTISFARSDSSGNYVYNITLTNGQVYEFTAPRGPGGAGSGDMMQSEYDADLSVSEAGGIADYVDGKVSPLQSSVSLINGKIPAQATSTNQLADKAFVNSSVQTGTANFRGNWQTWAAVPTDGSQYPADYAGGTNPTVNDYLVVSDASGYTGQSISGTWRFKYSGTWATAGKSGWHPEYPINGTPMTSAQLAALNSGITEAAVEQIATNTENISGKQDAITDLDDIRSGASAGTSAYQKPSTGIPKTDLAAAVRTSLEKADSALQAVPNTYRTAAAQNVIDSGKQETLVSGTNIKTVNNQSLLGSGNLDIGGSGVFVAEYGVTPYDEVLAAYHEGKIVITTVPHPSYDNEMIILILTWLEESDDPDPTESFADFSSLIGEYTCVDTWVDASNDWHELIETVFDSKDERRNALGRTSYVTLGDTSYTDYMARGEALFNSDHTPPQNGQIAWTYA